MQRGAHRAAALLAALFIAVVMLHAGGVAHAADTAPPIDDFFRNPSMSEARLSPSGKLLGVLIEGANGRMKLGVIDLDDPKRSKTVAAVSDADVRSFQWVNDHRLVFDLTDLTSPGGDDLGGGLFAVNADGSDFRRLVKHRPSGIMDGTSIASRELSWTHRLKDTLRDGSEDVVVQETHYGATREPLHVSLLRLNTVTGAATPLTKDAPAGAFFWVVDWKGDPRAVIALQEGLARLFWRDISAGQWVQLNESPLHDIPVDPLAVDASGTLYVRAARNDSAGTMALYRYDVAARKVEPEPLLSLAGFDFDGNLFFDPQTHVLRGASYRTDAMGTLWFDPIGRSLQAQVDKVLPSTVNLVSCQKCEDTRHVLVRSASDQQSTVFWLFDPKENQLKKIGAARPWIDPKQMAQRSFARIEARDGLSIPVYITKPRTGKGPWPAIVVVHDGPWMRGANWEWSGHAQFLASRGYLVIEPEFRGSTGFGTRHFHAGFKQWGLAMQDDLADAARWAVKQGMVDDNRICIAGSSYGGYAALMGLVKDGDLYRCGIDLGGMTDIRLIYDMNWSDMSELWKRYGIAKLVGDRDKDASQLDATSPLKQAGRIRQPVLLAYAGKDFRVPIEHGTRFRDAVSQHNKSVEWVDYPDEGRGFQLAKNRVDFWTRVEKFLARHLAPTSPAQAAKAPAS